MAWFEITITDISGNVKKGVRYDALQDVDAYKAKARNMAIEAIGSTLRDIQVIALADDSPQVYEHLQKRKEYFMSIWAKEGKYTGKEKYSDRNYGKPK